MELNELSPAARAAAQSQSITGEWDYASFGQLLQQLLSFDTLIDQRAKRRLSAMVVCIIVAFIGTIVGMILIDNDLETFGGILLFVGLSCIVGAVVFGRQWSKAKKMSLPEDNLAALLQLFRMIYRDLDPNGKIQTRIDLSGITPAKRGPMLVLPQAGYISRNQAIHVDAWCHIRFRLRDGYVVSMRQTDRITELVRTRRNSRGKQKTKTKYSKLCRVTATLIPKEPVQFQAPARVDPVWERVRAGNKKGRTVAVWDRWFLYKQKQDRPKKTPSGAELAGVLMRVCAVRPAQGR